jgi:hypothetical protein
MATSTAADADMIPEPDACLLGSGGSTHPHLTRLASFEIVLEFPLRHPSVP